MATFQDDLRIMYKTYKSGATTALDLNNDMAGIFSRAVSSTSIGIATAKNNAKKMISAIQNDLDTSYAHATDAFVGDSLGSGKLVISLSDAESISDMDSSIDLPKSEELLLLRIEVERWQAYEEMHRGLNQEMDELDIYLSTINSTMRLAVISEIPRHTGGLLAAVEALEDSNRHSECVERELNQKLPLTPWKTATTLRARRTRTEENFLIMRFVVDKTEGKGKLVTGMEEHYGHY
ncbi:hypothetical protein B0H63DRAFT_526934 [Podospora didyma]|uniref:Uncharacterized protein n=1 Tax=Podospora didyma TaxID=330526 RepID=A0AAE0K9E7_9PEZI|nr:hypothetical protein B0H63DRAFT_526934 [Podospora didyma]